MPNSKQHLKAGVLTGAAVSAGANIFQQLARKNENPDIRFDWAEFFVKTAVGGVVGGAAGLLPDILEPATSPFHRKFFHSITTVGLVAYTGYKVQTSGEIPEDPKALLMAAIMAYLSHLGMDSRTPMGLPLI